MITEAELVADDVVEETRNQPNQYVWSQAVEVRGSEVGGQLCKPGTHVVA